MAKSRPTINWIGHTIAGRYTIEALLGQGGMSAVYKATDPNLQRMVAIKIIHPHLSNDAQFVRRFEQEAAAIAKLRHPNIIQVYDFDHDEKLYYMVMEYVPGQNLKDRLNSLSRVNRRLPIEDTIRIMATICDAVAYAHEQNMIHRDLKPANVMLTPKGQPVLMDFGVAKLLDGVDHTATGAIIGTAKYLAPEQARGERPDERSDIYSLGVTLFEMLAGQPPFDADTTVAVLMKHVNEPIPDIQQIQSNISDDLVAIVEKALAKDRKDRYPSVAQLAADLRAIDLTMMESEAAKKTISSKKISSDTEMATQRALYAQLPGPTPPAVHPVLTSQPLTPAQASKRIPWLISGVAVAVLFLLGIGAFFAFSSFSGASGEGTEEAITSSIDPSLPSSEGMVQIRSGTYTVGVASGDGDHAAAQPVELSDFWIDQREVTNAQYAQFLAETDQQPPANWPAEGGPADQEAHPVKGITWDMATAYCEWANKRLPGEAEWEVAARGPESRLYPWGNDQGAVELPRSGTYPVGTKLTNQSAFGVLDMAGNVWEWVAEPYTPLENDDYRLLRGGSNDFLKDMAYRLQGDPAVPTMLASAGVRCAADEVNVVQTENARGEGVIYQDDFVDPVSGWPIASVGTFFFGYHPPDFFHVEVSTAESHTAVSLSQDYADTTVETEVLVDHTATETGDFHYGLVLRRTGEDEYYAFTVSPRTGAWQIFKSAPAGLELLEEGAVDTLQGFAPQGFTPDKTDRLRVDASGENFVFHINDKVVTQLSDSTYAKGEVGFFLENLDETLAHIHYDSLTIREAEVAAAPVVDLLYEDEFTNPESGWPVEDKEGAYRVGYHPPDYYHLEARSPDNSITASAPEMFDDVTVETDMFVDSTDTEAGDFRYGLMLRRMAEDKYYAFAVSSRSGRWYVLKQTPSGQEVLAEDQVDILRGFAPPGFSPDKPDLLRVDASGENFVFHINDKVVTQVSDAAYAEGEVGFFVENLDETRSHVHYDSVRIRKVDPEAISALPTATPEPTDEPTSTPEAISDTLPQATSAALVSEPAEIPEDMILILAGGFMMGSTTGAANETPAHEVLLDAFLIDLYELSNARYRACVEVGECTEVFNPDSYTRVDYRDDPAYDTYPVVGVTWDQAEAYCAWAGKRLPTEAEWEYAAGGPENLTWPWGNEFDLELSAAGETDTQPVESYPGGVSPFGLYNMAGNVNEWVQDIFIEDFYAGSPGKNPLASGASPDRIFRGGSFDNTDGALYTTSRRYVKNRTFSDVDVGFRCAKDVE